MTTWALAPWWDGILCNIGIALELSSTAALDIDEGIESEDELREFLSDLGIPVTRAIRSGRTSSFGVHLLYSGVMNSGSFVIEWRGKLVKGEVKSKYKYVAAEGSFHKSGNQYTRLWNLPLTETPVALFTDILARSVKKAQTTQSAPSFSGQSVQQDELETYFDKNDEEVTLEGFNKSKNALEYIRVEGCPWQELHKQPNGPKDFAIYLGRTDSPSTVFTNHAVKDGRKIAGGRVTRRGWRRRTESSLCNQLGRSPSRTASRRRHLSSLDH